VNAVVQIPILPTAMGLPHTDAWIVMKLWFIGLVSMARPKNRQMCLWALMTLTRMDYRMSLSTFMSVTFILVSRAPVPRRMEGLIFWVEFHRGLTRSNSRRSIDITLSLISDLSNNNWRNKEVDRSIVTSSCFELQLLQDYTHYDIGAVANDFVPVILTDRVLAIDLPELEMTSSLTTHKKSAATTQTNNAAGASHKKTSNSALKNRLRRVNCVACRSNARSDAPMASKRSRLPPLTASAHVKDDSSENQWLVKPRQFSILSVICKTTSGRCRKESSLQHLPRPNAS
jgi:hypothetical protein